MRGLLLLALRWVGQLGQDALSSDRCTCAELLGVQGDCNETGLARNVSRARLRVAKREQERKHNSHPKGRPETTDSAAPTAHTHRQNSVLQRH